MKQHYKSFMDKQHPSGSLIKDTVQKAQTASQKPFQWQLACAAAAVFCLLAGAVWKWNFRIVYTDLNGIAVSENSEALSNPENVGQIQQSYLGNNESFLYVFDKNARTSEIWTKHGKISVQTGSVLNTGIQALYQTRPRQVKGYKVYFGKLGNGNDRLILAAFVKENKQYYLEGDGITEEEMTTVVKDLLK